MKIAIIEDNEQELNKAAKAVKDAGHKAIPILVDGKKEMPNWLREIKSADGIITDLFFNPVREGRGGDEYYKEDPPPAGLLVVLYAAHHNLPVIVCTKAYEEGGKEGHHGKALSWIYDGFFYPTGTIDERYEGFDDQIFGLNEKKDWEVAVYCLERKFKRKLTNKSVQL